MRILHAITSLSPRSGGPTVTLQALAKEQARQGHIVVICTTNSDNPSGELQVKTNRAICFNNVESWFFSINFFKLLCVSFSLAKWVKLNISKFDIVHVHGLYRFPPTYVAWQARRQGIPYIIRPHGNLDPYLFMQSRHSLRLKRIYERLFDMPNIKRATAIHYTAKEEALNASFLGLPTKSIIVPNGIDFKAYENLPRKGSFRKRIGVKNHIKLVLFLGRINFKKGLDLLVPAFRHVVKGFPEAHLAIVGPDNDNYASKVKRWCIEQDIISSVTFVGYLSPEETKQAYIDSDLFVLPSYSENFGMSIVEAMACGCPVIVSNKVNIWHEIQDHHAGYVVNLNYLELAQAIIRLIADKGTALAMGHRGRNLAKSKFALPKITSQLIGKYKELIL